MHTLKLNILRSCALFLCLLSIGCVSEQEVTTPKAATSSAIAQPRIIDTPDSAPSTAIVAANTLTATIVNMAGEQQTAVAFPAAEYARLRFKDFLQLCLPSQSLIDFRQLEYSYCDNGNKWVWINSSTRFQGQAFSFITANASLLLPDTPLTTCGNDLTITLVTETYVNNNIIGLRKNSCGFERCPFKCIACEYNGGFCFKGRGCDMGCPNFT